MDASVVTDENATVPDGLLPGEMAGLFRLEVVEVDMFRARGVPGEPGRLFGGQVAAQALAAAAAAGTVTGVRPHSLHAYFLRLSCGQVTPAGRCCSRWTDCATGARSAAAGCPRSRTVSRS